VDAGSFSLIHLFGKLEIHKVFLRFPNIGLAKNLSPSTLADFIQMFLSSDHRFFLARTLPPRFSGAAYFLSYHLHRTHRVRAGGDEHDGRSETGPAHLPARAAAGH
jgi:hypothetical protein